MKALMTVAMAVGLVVLAGTTRADDKKNDPTGTWKVTTEFGGQKRESTLKLKLDGDKLSGKLIAAGKDGKEAEMKIDDGKYKDGMVAFAVTRDFQGQKVVTTYKAKVDGDTMKGTIEGKFGEKEFKQEFEGKREKAKD